MAPDADAMVSETATFRYVDCPSCGGMLKPDIVYFGENVAKDRVEQAYSLVDECGCAAGRRVVADGVLRLPVRAARGCAAAIPVAIINRGPTRGDDVATVKVDGGCSRTAGTAGRGTVGRSGLVKRLQHRVNGARAEHVVENHCGAADYAGLVAVGGRQDL